MHILSLHLPILLGLLNLELEPSDGILSPVHIASHFLDLLIQDHSLPLPLFTQDPVLFEGPLLFLLEHLLRIFKEALRDH